MYLFRNRSRAAKKKSKNKIKANKDAEKKPDATQEATPISTISKRDEFTSKNNLSWEDKIKITEILRKEAIAYQKGEYKKAKALIVEWLALDKKNRLLNLELANIYNKESEFKKSEYIYRELIENSHDDFELLKKLWFVLALQKKYKDSIRVYKEAYEKKSNDPWVVDILSDLTFEVKDYESSLKFTKQYLKEKPRDTEKLQIEGLCYEALWEKNNAMHSFQKILELQPYNEEILEKVQLLQST